MISARQYGVSVISYVDDPDFLKLYSLLKDCRIVVDSILGTGVSRPLEGRLKDIILAISDWRLKESRNQLLAVDLPTGVDPDSGWADPSSLVADYTFVLGFPKKGLFQFPGADHIGKITILDIGIPSEAVDNQNIDLELLSPGWVGNALPARPRNSH